MRHIAIALLFLGAIQTFSQDITATQLLDKAISYHDPNNQWKGFNTTFHVVMETPKSSDRKSSIHLNIPKEFFELEVEKDGVRYAYRFEKENCTTSLNGSDTVSDDDRKKYRLTCERGRLMKNYYTYLYGLPMKLKDPGTNLDNTVERKVFKGKEYLVLKVNYDKDVGDDIWYFYFDPITFAMEVYQFYHDEQKGDGEYILLKDIEEINGIKMPKTRAWYYNSDDTYLGTDILSKAE
ncbi:DUF6503 family protein [Flagellimonas meridianipacifica]|uniref:Uncharacterized protein n=1 Tax=Flagellimonas meridianipacifica TaxID=1080225 RepID=A0A2T0MHT1_9FLAO|nr:DUF6503 family protein [Allomuricauda pacifica]PRX57122.1 hypothetical protein CLV81_1123 [Allomuricauda pacifica]